METIISVLRSMLGEPDFYQQLHPNSTQFTWNYGEMFEYMIGASLLVLCVCFVFRLLLAVIGKCGK